MTCPPNPNRGGQHHQGTERMGALGMRKCRSDEEVPVGCQLFNNRKCGNKKKCLQIRKTLGKRRQVQNQDRASLALSSWERGEKMIPVKGCEP